MTTFGNFRGKPAKMPVSSFTRSSAALSHRIGNPLSTIGAGVKEIRIHGRSEYRVIYVAKFADAIYVLHTFIKKTPQTSRIDIELARTRFKQLLVERRRQS